MISGAAHIHSKYSYDGKVPLKELRDLAKAEGLSFLLMSEHSDGLTHETAEAFVHECAALSDDSFTMIPGFEVPYGKAHVLMYGCRTFLAQHADGALVERWSKEAAFVVVAHPHRDGYRLDDTLRAVADGIEVWNGQYDGKRVPRTEALRLYKECKSGKPDMKAFAAWDFHRASHAGGPRIELRETVSGEAAILAALKMGAYSISSPCVSLRNDGSVLRGSPAALESALTIEAIRAGKVVNRALAALGLKLPRSFVASIRRRM